MRLRYAIILHCALSQGRTFDASPTGSTAFPEREASFCGDTSDCGSFVEKSVKFPHPEEPLLFECGPESPGESRIPRESPAGSLEGILSRERSTFLWRLFGSVTLSQTPYVCNLRKSLHAETEPETPHKTLLNQTREILSTWYPNILGAFYFFVVLLSVASTYRLDGLEVSHSVKAAIREGTEHLLEWARERVFPQERVLFSPEVSAYLVFTHAQILSGNFLLLPSLIEEEPLRVFEAAVREKVQALGMRGSELPKCVESFAGICTGQSGIPSSGAYALLRRLLRLHATVYSYEGMKSALEDASLRCVSVDHARHVLLSFSSDLTGLLLATRRHFSESASLRVL
ncbi:uncharacterized protein NEMAJ01_1828 [Nematocida major]|uniref:uncharacterized protein n=1 Tax=Nematocida major TaxID=1912982 RepID=UPI002008C45A|nr:uncharacterized protein NEMAJ01_1828 [Nematocida major]KAH9386932.1 hypothetical protein NEMAJ01_1828 [Nematocida major]